MAGLAARAGNNYEVVPHLPHGRMIAARIVKHEHRVQREKLRSVQGEIQSCSGGAFLTRGNRGVVLVEIGFVGAFFHRRQQYVACAVTGKVDGGHQPGAFAFPNRKVADATAVAVEESSR